MLNTSLNYMNTMKNKNKNNPAFLIDTYLEYYKWGSTLYSKGLLKLGKGRLPVMGPPFPSNSLRIRNPFCILHNEPSALWISLHRLLNWDLDLIFPFLCSFLSSNWLPHHCHCKRRVFWGRLLPQFTGTSQRANNLEEL